MNLFKKWKEEWWAKREAKLLLEFSSQERQLKDEQTHHIEKDKASFQKSYEKMHQEMQAETRALELHKADLDEMMKRVDDKKAELAHKNDGLLQQIRLIEAKASPSGVWVEAFSLGFSKAWDMMLPIMQDGVLKSRQFIEETAITETLERLNGNHKTAR